MSKVKWTQVRYDGATIKGKRSRYWVTFRQVRRGQPPIEYSIQVGLNDRGDLSVFGVVSAGRPLTDQLIRSLPLTDMKQQAATVVREEGDRQARALGYEQQEKPLSMLRLNPKSDEYLAAVASACRRARAEGQPMPATIKSQLDVGPATISRDIERARHRYEETGDAKFNPGPNRLAREGESQTTRKSGGTQKKGTTK